MKSDFDRSDGSKLSLTLPVKGFRVQGLGFRAWGLGFRFRVKSKLLVSPLIMENQMEKKMENEMETALYRVMYWIIGVIV